MPYLGDIPQAGGYTINVTDATSKVAVTVFNIRRDRISEVELVVLTPAADGSATTGPRPINSNVGRIVITAGVISGSATLTIGGATIALATDAMITFDVI